MRILIAHHHRTVVGGVETYLAALIPALAAAGHELFFLHEEEFASEKETIPLPQNVVASRSFHEALRWEPDLAFVHFLDDVRLQRQIIDAYPSVAFAHGYYGLCISGSKTWRRPTPRPCAKNFSWTCLLHFHARQCGGLSPITMARDYLRASQKLALLKRCDAILTHGGQMHREYIDQGISENRLHVLPHFVPPAGRAPQPHEPGPTAKLIFIGRFEQLKGAALLFDALPQVAGALKRPVHLQMAGAGHAGEDWKRRAEVLRSKNVSVEFSGWVNTQRRDELLAASDLLVVPSVWPEPFGQIGLEAASLGVPAVAFDVGGISGWLREGVNGHFAPANPPTSKGLAAAIAKALEKPGHYAKLRAGAAEVAIGFSMQRHLEALIALFEAVAKTKR